MTLYARIEAGLVMERLETEADIATLFPPELVWVPATSDVQQGWRYADGVFSAPPSPPAPDIPAQVVPMVQERLDAFAQTRGYDGILSACTYSASTVAKFQAEGSYCVKARDAHWSTCYQLLGEVQAGTRKPPTVDEVAALLPALAWPV